LPTPIGKPPEGNPPGGGTPTLLLAGAFVAAFIAPGINPPFPPIGKPPGGGTPTLLLAGRCVAERAAPPVPPIEKPPGGAAVAGGGIVIDIACCGIGVCIATGIACCGIACCGIGVCMDIGIPDPPSPTFEKGGVGRPPPVVCAGGNAPERESAREKDRGVGCVCVFEWVVVMMLNDTLTQTHTHRC